MCDRSRLTRGSVCLFCQRLQYLEELGFLSGEQPIIRQRYDGRQSTGEFIVGRANDSAAGQIWADEFARHGENEIGLKMGTARGRVEIRKRKAVIRHRGL